MNKLKILLYRVLLNLIKVSGSVYFSYLLIGDHQNDAEWTSLIPFTLLIPSGWYISILIKRTIQDERNRFAKIIKNDPTDQKFSLYLKPFRHKPLIDTPVYFCNSSMTNPNFFSIQDTCGFDDILTYAMESSHPLVDLNPPNDRSIIYPINKYKPCNIIESDADWENEFRLLVKHAYLIIIYPGLDSIGLMNEIKFIKNNNLLNKCIFVRPSLVTIKDENMKAEIVDGWHKAAEYLKHEINILLPPFENFGVLFKINSVGKPYAVVELPTYFTYLSIRYPEVPISPEKLHKAIQQVFMINDRTCDDYRNHADITEQISFDNEYSSNCYKDITKNQHEYIWYFSFINYLSNDRFNSTKAIIKKNWLIILLYSIWYIYFIGIIFALIKNPNSNYYALLLLVSAYAFQYIVRYYEKNRRKKIQATIEKETDEIISITTDVLKKELPVSKLDKDFGLFWLFMKPLKLRLLLPHKSEFRFFIQKPPTDSLEIDFETVLTWTLGGFGKTVAFHKPESNITDFGKEKNPDNEWKDIFKVIANKALIIAMIPIIEDNDYSTVWEISYLLHNNLLYKTVFFQPPEIVRVVPRNIDLEMDNEFTETIEDYWTSSREFILNQVNIEIPLFEEQGLMFKLDNSGKLLKSEHVEINEIFDPIVTVDWLKSNLIHYFKNPY